MERRDTTVYLSYDDPKILDEIALKEFLFLNVSGGNRGFLERKALLHGNERHDSYFDSKIFLGLVFAIHITWLAMAELDWKETQGLRLQLNTRSHLYPNRLH